MLILREAGAAIRRTPLMSIMTAFVIAVSLAIIGIFALLSLRANELLTEFKKKVTIEVYFEPNVSSLDARNTADGFVKGLKDVLLYTFITKEDALKEYVERSGEDVERVLGYNPFPSGCRLNFTNLTSAKIKDVTEELSRVAGIKDIMVDRKTLAELEKRQATLETLTYALGGIFFAIAFAIVAATIRLAMQSRREAIRTMRLLGARRSTIILPYFIEGGFAGLIGGLLGASLLYLFHEQMLPGIAPELVTGLMKGEELYIVIGSLVAAGLVIGAAGSLIASLRTAR